MEKLDLSKRYKKYFSAGTKPEIVDVGEARFLSIEGKGDPSGKEFVDKIQPLYATAYAIKFLFKSLKKDFVVSKLEGLWWFDEKKYNGFTISEAPQKIPRSEWEYRLLIRMPEYVTENEVKSAIATVYEGKKLSLAKTIELHRMKEGKCVQVMHAGAFDREPETLQKIQSFMEAEGLWRKGLHHEIYLRDFRKTATDKLKTILREPVR